MTKFHLFSLIACVITTYPLAAQPAVVVTPGNIADRVRSQNPELAAARLRIREAIGRMTQAGRLSNPELELGIENNARFREGRFEIGFSQRFPVTDRLRLEKEISLTEIKAAEAEVREVARQLTGKAHESLVRVMATRQRRDLLRQQSAVVGEFADFLSATATKGEGSSLDAGQARLEAASLDTKLRQLDAQEAALVGELKPLLGMLAGESLSVSGSLPAPVLPSNVVDPAKRPDYQVAALNTEAAASRVSLEKARRYDDVEGGIFAGAERSEDVPEGYENEAIVGLRFKIPLPFWNNNEGAIMEAEARKQRMEMETAALGRVIHLEAEAARSEMTEWMRLIREIDDSLLPLANEQGKLTEDAYRNGQGEIQAVLRSREKRLELAAARLDALREFHLARVRYETALGKP